MKFNTSLKVLVAMHALPAMLLGSFFTVMFVFCGDSFVHGIEQSPGKTSYVQNLAKSSHDENLPFQFPLKDYRVALPVLLKNKASRSAASRRQAIFDRVLAASNLVLAEKAEKQERMLAVTVNRKMKSSKKERGQPQKKRTDTPTYSPTPSPFSTCPMELQQAVAKVEEQEKVIDGLIKELEKYEEEDLEVVTQQSKLCRFRRQRSLYVNDNSFKYFLEAIAMDPVTQEKDKNVRTHDFILNFSRHYGKNGSIILVSNGEKIFEGGLQNIINTKFSYAEFYDLNSTSSIYGNEDPERNLARVKFELNPSPLFFEKDFFDEETGFSKDIQDCSLFIDESKQYSDEYTFANIDTNLDGQITRAEMKSAFDIDGASKLFWSLGVPGSDMTLNPDSFFDIIDTDNSDAISKPELKKYSNLNKISEVYADVKFPTGVNTKLGLGFDSSAAGGGATRTPWVDIPKCTDVVEGTKVACVDDKFSRSNDPAVYQASFIHNSKSLEKSMSLAVKAQAGYMGATASASAEYATNQEFTQDSVTNLLTASRSAWVMKIKNQGDMKLRATTLSMLSAERFPEGAEKFLRDFGFFSTTAITIGGTFNGSFKLTASTQQAVAELKVSAEVQGSSGAFSAEGSVAYEQKQDSRSKSISSTARMETTGGTPPSSNDPQSPMSIVNAHTKWSKTIEDDENLVNLYQTVSVWSGWTVIYDLMDTWQLNKGNDTEIERRLRVHKMFMGISAIGNDEATAASLEQIQTKLLIKTLEKMKEWSTIKNNESSMRELKDILFAATKYNNRMENSFNVMAIEELRDELRNFEEGNDDIKTNATTSWLLYRKTLEKNYNELVAANLLPLHDSCSADSSCHSGHCCFGNCFSGFPNNCYQEHPKGNAAQCSTKKFDDNINFCRDWCNVSGKWPDCGTNQLNGNDERNTDDEDYRCSCNGCNGCKENPHVVEWPSPQKSIQIQTKNLNTLYTYGSKPPPRKDSKERTWDVFDGQNKKQCGKQKEDGSCRKVSPPYTYTENGSTSQGFFIKDDQIVHTESTNAIGVEGSASTNFVELFMTPASDKPILKQQWMYLSNGDIINRLSGYCVSFLLDIDYPYDCVVLKTLAGGVTWCPDDPIQENLMKYPLFVQKCSDKHTYFSQWNYYDPIFQNPLWTFRDH